MKNAKAMALMLVCGLTTIFSLSSCLDNDGGGNGGVIPTMTLADSIEACQKMIGSYSGKLYYINPNKPQSSEDRQDSVDVRCNISSETIKTNSLVMENFPVKPLALYVVNSSSQDKSKEVLEASDTQTLTTNATPYIKLTGQNFLLYQLNIKPKQNTLDFNTEYDGGIHHVTVVFTETIRDLNNYTYYPIAQFNNGIFQGNICIDKVYVDGYEHKITTVFGFKVKK